MAIPFSVPTQEDPEDAYRHLDVLFEHLLITLREVIRYRRLEASAAVNNPQLRRRSSTVTPTRVSCPPPAPSQDTQTTCNDTATRLTEPTVSEPSPRLPLPDLIPRTECEQQRPKDECRNQPSVHHDDPSSLTWVQVGAELRHIADQFRDTNTIDKSEEKDKPSRTSVTNLLSFLRPQLGGWTLALLLGYGLIYRSR